MNISERPAIDGQIVFLYTPDLEDSARFYGELLGLEQVLDQGSCRIFRSAPGAYVGVCRRADRPQSPVGLTLSLVSADVDAWHARLQAAGAEIVEPPRYSEEFRVYAMLARDPAGYRVEIQSFRDPRWPGA